MYTTSETKPATSKPIWLKAYIHLFRSEPWEPVQRPWRWWYLPLSFLLGGPVGVFLAVFKDRIAVPTVCFVLWALLSMSRFSLLGTSLLFGAGHAYLFALGIRLKMNKSGVALIPFILVFATIFYLGWRNIWGRM